MKRRRTNLKTECTQHQRAWKLFKNDMFLDFFIVQNEYLILNQIVIKTRGTNHNILILYLYFSIDNGTSLWRGNFTFFKTQQSSYSISVVSILSIFDVTICFWLYFFLVIRGIFLSSIGSSFYLFSNSDKSLLFFSRNVIILLLNYPTPFGLISLFSRFANIY